VCVCARSRAFCIIYIRRWDRTSEHGEHTHIHIYIYIYNLRRATRETVTKLAPCIICPRRYSWRTYVVQLRVSSAFCTNRIYLYMLYIICTWYIYIHTHIYVICIYRRTRLLVKTSSNQRSLLQFRVYTNSTWVQI